jgi:hypothetical protein
MERAKFVGAVILLALVLVGCASGARPAVAPSASQLPMPEAGESSDGAHVPIEAGTHLIPRSAWSVADFTVTFPAGWGVQYGHVYAKHGDEPDEFGFYPVVVDEIYNDSCAPEDESKRRVGPGIDDLYAALRDQAGGAAISKPVPTTLGDHPASRIDLRIPNHLDVAGCRMAPGGLQIWYSEPADKYFVLLREATASVYVLDVGGKRQLFVIQVADATSAADRAELKTVLDSIHISG